MALIISNSNTLILNKMQISIYLHGSITFGNMILITTSYTYITHTLSLFPLSDPPYYQRGEGFSYFKHEIPKQ